MKMVIQKMFINKYDRTYENYGIELKKLVANTVTTESKNNLKWNKLMILVVSQLFDVYPFVTSNFLYIILLPDMGT